VFRGQSTVHPVTFTMAAIVVPCGRRSSAITLACLEPARIVGWPDAWADLRDFADRAGGFFGSSSAAAAVALAARSPVSSEGYRTSRAKRREFGGESLLDEFSISEI
jgi:hypothetical protein